MTPELIITIFGVIVVVITIVVIVIKKAPKRIKSVHYIRKWRDIQKLCKNKEDWNHAIIHADMLLDEVLIKKKFTGKTMGERLVSAHDKFKSNDDVWRAHKLANSIRQQEVSKLKESDVKGALIAFRQSLKDLGAI